MALLFVVGVLAVWRAAILITEDEGPFSAFAYIRDHIDPHQKTWVGRGLNCAWCVSWWAGLIATLWLWAFSWLDASLIPIWWFGMSGGAILLHGTLAYLSRRK